LVCFFDSDYILLNYVAKKSQNINEVLSRVLMTKFG